MDRETKLKIKEIITRKLKLDMGASDFDESRPLIEYGIGIDSVANLELIVEIEKALKLNLDESGIDGEVLFNLENLYRFIDNNS